MNKHRLIVIAALGILVSSCAPLYVPTTRNVALFRGPGEFQGSMHFGLGIDAQAAASITKHLGIAGGYNFVSRNTTVSDTEDYVKHTEFEGSLGYYENTGNLCYEFFGGYGRGEGTAYGDYFSSSNIKGNGTYNKFFVQPSVGSNNHIFNWIVSARMSLVDFDNISSADITQPVSFNIDPEPVLFIEPAFTGRVFFGKSPIYSQFQVGFSYTPQGDTVFEYEPFNFSFGFGLRLGGTPRESADQ